MFEKNQGYFEVIFLVSTGIRGLAFGNYGDASSADRTVELVDASSRNSVSSSHSQCYLLAPAKGFGFNQAKNLLLLRNPERTRRYRDPNWRKGHGLLFAPHGPTHYVNDDYGPSSRTRYTQHLSPHRWVL